MRNGLTFFTLILVSITSLAVTPLEPMSVDETTPIADWLPDFFPKPVNSYKRSTAEGCEVQVKLKSELMLRPNELWVVSNRYGYSVEGPTRTNELPKIESGAQCDLAFRISRDEMDETARAGVKVYGADQIFRLKAKSRQGGLDGYLAEKISGIASISFFGGVASFGSYDLMMTCEKATDEPPLSIGDLDKALSHLASVQLVCPVNRN